MSADLERLEARLAQLRREHDGVEAARTREAAVSAAAAFLEGARARSEGLGGLIIGGHAGGQPLADVMQAFVLSDPRLGPLLAEQAETFAELTEKAKTTKLRKLDEQIAEATAELLAARKQVALAAIEAEFATSGEAG